MSFRSCKLTVPTDNNCIAVGALSPFSCIRLVTYKLLGSGDPCLVPVCAELLEAAAILADQGHSLAPLHGSWGMVWLHTSPLPAGKHGWVDQMEALVRPCSFSISTA